MTGLGDATWLFAGLAGGLLHVVLLSRAATVPTRAIALAPLRLVLVGTFLVVAAARGALLPAVLGWGLAMAAGILLARRRRVA